MRWHSISALIATALASAACSGAAEGPALELPDMPKMPNLESVAALAVPKEPPKGSATELYTKVARGAVGCWFGATGPLKAAYIYHAEADAPSRGGKAEITIHQRDPTNANPRGPKAYLIKFDPKDEQNATITAENLKMSEGHAAAMAADVDRWSRGDAGCEGKSTTAGWAPEAPPAAAAVPVKAAAKKPAKKKASTPAAASAKP